MSSTAQKMIIFAAVMLLTVLVISIGFGLFGKVREANNTNTEKIDNLVQRASEAEVIQYDGLCISGATAVSYARNIYASVTDVVFYQNEGSKDSGTVYLSIAEVINSFGDESATFRDMKNPDAYRAPSGPSGNGYYGRYIDPLATYYVEIERIGGAIDKVTITKQD